MKTNIGRDQTSNISDVAELLKTTIPSSEFEKLKTNKQLKTKFEKECESELRPSTRPGKCDAYEFKTSDTSSIIKGNILCQIRKSDYFDKQVLVKFYVNEKDVQTFSMNVIEHEETIYVCNN